MAGDDHPPISSSDEEIRHLLLRCARDVDRVRIAGAGPDDDTAATAVTASSTVRASAAIPAYSIIGPADRRTDGQPAFIVAIDPVDTNSDRFKDDVRSVLTAISSTEGGASFSAKVFDDKSVADGASFPAQTGQSSPAPDMEQRAGAHLVAWYSVGMNSGLGYPYDINWYPGAHRDTPIVRRYVGYEEWKP